MHLVPRAHLRHGIICRWFSAGVAKTIQIANEVEDNNKHMRYGATVYETLRVCGYTIEHFSETMVMDKAVMVPVAPQPIA